MNDGIISAPDEAPNLSLQIDPAVLLERALQTGNETSEFDFKEDLNFRNVPVHKIRLLKAIGAFANTDNGGHIFVGVSDERVVKGVTDEVAESYEQTKLQALVDRYFVPPAIVQVRQHTHKGLRIVVVQVQPFRDVPCFVSKSEAANEQEKITAGTFLTRTLKADSSLLTTESEVRRLCDAIVARRARNVIELFQRGTIGMPSLFAPPAPPLPRFEALGSLRTRADGYWSSAPGGRPYLEVFFAPEQPLSIDGRTLHTVFPHASVATRDHGFPFHVALSSRVHRNESWGELGIIPALDPNLQEQLHPTYLWLLSREGAFLNRTHFWEDDQRSSLKNSLGIYGLSGQLILMVRFLDRLTRRLDVPEGTTFRVGVAVHNSEGRFLSNEMMGYAWSALRGASEPHVESHIDLTLAQLRAGREEAVLNLTSQLGWEVGQTAWNRETYLQFIRNAPNQIGGEYLFPQGED